MEGVGSRVGRSSTRYGAGPSPAVFSGPVRKWKKKWVTITAPVTKKKQHSTKRDIHNNTLSLFKWTTLSDQDHPPTPRKFRYIPIAKLEEQKNEAEVNKTSEKFGDRFKPNETNFSSPKANSKKTFSEEKPDINDMPMYENQGRGGKIARQDLNEGTFDLSLG